MSYGRTTRYGLGAFGGAASSLSVEAAWPISTHTVRVELSAEPKHVSAFDVGDALNPASWTVLKLVTGYQFTVIGAELHDATHVDVHVLEALGNHLETHRVTAVGLLANAGFPASNPLTADFLGTVQTIDPLQAVALDRFLDRDLANPPLQGDSGFSGTLQIGADGDYETESGIPLAKKLVIRRIATPRGAFPHLPRYGIGILEKEPIQGSGNLVALRTEIESQLLEEPDIEDARAALMLDRSNVLFIQLRVRLAGNGATFDMQLSPANGQLVEL